MDRSGIPSYGFPDVDFSTDDVVPGPPLLGDFYRDVDTVCRGVSLPVAPSSSQDWHSSILKGVDPYAEDDVTRSVTLPPDFGYLDPQPYDKIGGFEPPGFSTWDYQKNDMYGSSATYEGFKIYSGIDGQQSTTRFTADDILPPAPMDPFFSFAVTTLIVSLREFDSPYELMNLFVDFLMGQKNQKGAPPVASEILKINRKKFCVKANVFLNNMMCTLKARAYQQETGQMAFEVQRRCGDTVTFNGVYRHAAHFLQERYIITRGVPQAMGAAQITPPIPEGKVEVCHWEPILEMAKQTPNSPELQAEAASTMSSWIEDAEPEAIDALCTDSGVVEAIKELLKTDCVDICYPTTKLLLRLADSGSAMHVFFGDELADKSLVQIILEKVKYWNSTSETSMVRQQFAQVISSVAKTCGPRMPGQDACLFANQINAAMATTSTEPDIYRSLQDAYLLLMQRT
jgi:hypothetical protein